MVVALKPSEEQRRRYARALRLSQFVAGRGSRDADYRARCLENWQMYLDRGLVPPTTEE